MAVDIAAGSVAVPTVNGTGSTLCASDAIEQVVLPAAPASGTNRTDLIICRPRGADLDGGANNDFIFDYVRGADGGGVPATPPGTAALAQVLIIGGSAAVDPANITDVRPSLLAPPRPSIYFDVIGKGSGQNLTGTNTKVAAAWASPRVNQGGGTWANGTYTVPRPCRLRIHAALGTTCNTAYNANWALMFGIWKNNPTSPVIVCNAAYAMPAITQPMGVNCATSGSMEFATGDVIEMYASMAYNNQTGYVITNNTKLTLVEESVPLTYPN
jgi:hypothetical protein